MWASLLINLLQFGPALLGDAEAVFNDVAHGPGGEQKIGNVVASLAHLANNAAGAAQAAGFMPTQSGQAQAAQSGPGQVSSSS